MSTSKSFVFRLCAAEGVNSLMDDDPSRVCVSLVWVKLALLRGDVTTVLLCFRGLAAVFDGLTGLNELRLRAYRLFGVDRILKRELWIPLLWEILGVWDKFLILSTCWSVQVFLAFLASIRLSVGNYFIGETTSLPSFFRGDLTLTGES